LRWAVVSVLFIVAMFGFFIGYSVSSLLLDTFADALIPVAAAQAVYLITLIEVAFGVICAVCVTLIVFVYFVESLSDEPETYWRRYPR